MKKITERDIVAFAVDFVKKAGEIDEWLFCEPDYIFRWCNKKITLYDIYMDELTIDGVLQNCEVTEYNVSDYTDSDEYIAHLCAEGELYETMYYYEAYGVGGEKSEAILDAARTASENNGLGFEWASGALFFYVLEGGEE